MPKPDDPEIVKPFCEAISKGHSVATAATLAGISERAAHEWMQRGNEVLDAHDGETEESLDELGAHALFTLAVKMAEADFVSSKVGEIDRAAKGEGGWGPGGRRVGGRRRGGCGEHAGEMLVHLRSTLGLSNKQGIP